jgi:hypothetical protein
MADQSDIYSYLKTAGIRDNGEETFKKFSYYLDSYMMRKKAI